MSYWLSKKKKADLVELCESVGLRTDGLKKADLEDSLRSYLEEHYNELKDHELFQPYYETVPRSPVKLINPPDAVLPEGEKRARRRTSRYIIPGTSTIESEDNYRSSPSATKETTVTPPPEEGSTSVQRSLRSLRSRAQNRDEEGVGESETTALIHTPRSQSALSGQIPLPPSPAVVATAIELRANILKQRTKEVIDTIAITDHLESTREKLSNVISVYGVVSLYEVSMLLKHLLPLTYHITIPPISALNIDQGNNIYHLPDLFVLLSSAFWYPFLTYLFTFQFLPLVVAYFFNLTIVSSSPVPKEAASPPQTTSSALVRRTPRQLPETPRLSPAPQQQQYPYQRQSKLFDFLSYSIAKALISYLIYHKGFYLLGLVSEKQTQIVASALGKEVGLIGAGIVGTVGVWEGILIAGGSR